MERPMALEQCRPRRRVPTLEGRPRMLLPQRNVLAPQRLPRFVGRLPRKGRWKAVVQVKPLPLKNM